LLQLFHVARRFEMEVQPQLVLLQKTLLNIEGLGRQLYPDLDLWATGKPFLQRWVVKSNSPQALIKRFVDQAPAILKAMPEMPMLVHDYLRLQNHTANNTMTRTGKLSMPVQYAQMQRSSFALRRSITGASLVVLAGLLGAASIIGTEGDIHWWIWALGMAGVVFLVAGLKRS